MPGATRVTTRSIPTPNDSGTSIISIMKNSNGLAGVGPGRYPVTKKLIANKIREKIKPMKRVADHIHKYIL